jgi:hypothetical protein
MDLTVHVYHHMVPGGVDPSIAKILTQLGVIDMAIADIKAAVDTLTAKVAAEETVIDSENTLLAGLSAIIADLTAQLKAANAANDPAAIQAVVDSLGALGVKVDADKQKMADATVANTPAA